MKNFFVLLILIFFNLNSKSKEWLRLVSYNINNEIKWSKKKADICKLLKEQDADIVLLQEVDKPYIARQLAKKLNLNFNKKYWHKGGMAILSRQKVVDSINIDVPDSHYNAVVAIKIESGVWICNVHLWSEDYKIDESERLREINFILNELKKLNADHLIIGGDFNCLSDCQVDKLLKDNEFIHVSILLDDRGTWMPAETKEEIDRFYVKGFFTGGVGEIIDHNDVDWLKNKGWPTGNDHRLVNVFLEYAKED